MIAINPSAEHSYPHTALVQIGVQSVRWKVGSALQRTSEKLLLPTDPHYEDLCIIPESYPMVKPVDSNRTWRCELGLVDDCVAVWR